MQEGHLQGGNGCKRRINDKSITVTNQILIVIKGRQARPINTTFFLLVLIHNKKIQTDPVSVHLEGINWGHLVPGLLNHLKPSVIVNIVAQACIYLRLLCFFFQRFFSLPVDFLNEGKESKESHAFIPNRALLYVHVNDKGIFVREPKN